MISSVRGSVLSVLDTIAVIEVGGVGLSVTVTPQHALSLHAGSTVLLHTALIVRDDDLALFGFADPEELAVFDLLRGVSGVGPKSAMGVLAAMTPQQISSAVIGEDDAAFRKVSGIGPKTAKLIVVSLAGKVKAVTSIEPAPAVIATTVTENVLAALISLGWSERVATQAIHEAIASESDHGAANVPGLLRSALARLGPTKPAEAGRK